MACRNPGGFSGTEKTTRKNFGNQRHQSAENNLGSLKLGPSLNINALGVRGFNLQERSHPQRTGLEARRIQIE
jgi:hypothetical protein